MLLRMLTLYCELVRLSVHSDPGAAAPSSRDAKRLRNTANEWREAELGYELSLCLSLCACKVLAPNCNEPSI